MKRILMIFQSLKVPHPLSGWKKLIADAVTFQIEQTVREDVLPSAKDPAFNHLVDELYFFAMKMFLRDTEPLRQSASTKEYGRDAMEQLFEHFQWLAVRPPVPSALE